jgi:hypothetical protein
MNNRTRTALAAVALFVAVTPALPDEQHTQPGILGDVLKPVVAAVLVGAFFILLTKR